MKITKIITLITVILFMFNSCKTTDFSYNVINIKDAKGIRNNAIMYFLPKTVVKTQVKIKKTIQKKGLFSNYAKKHLNIENAIIKDNQIWEIVDVNFSTYPIIDSTKLYIIEHKKEVDYIDIQLSSCGVLKSINSNNKLSADLINKEVYNEKIFQKSTIGILTKTKEINFNEVALPKQVVNSRTLSEKAKALSDIILTLREDRAATIVGDGYTKNIPNGASLSIMIDNMNKLEKQYLALFKGKTKEEEYTFSFDFIPQETRDLTQKILFRFSSKEGVVEKTNMDGVPIILELNASGNLKQVIGFDKRQEHLKRIARIDNNKKGLHYTVPDKVTAKLLMNNNYLAEKDILLSQFGVTQYLPSKYLNGNYSIVMNYKFGSIRSLKKTNKE